MKTSKPNVVIKLPEPKELAKLVNHFIDPNSRVESRHVDEAIKKAVRSYLRSALFYRDHQNDSLIELAKAVSDSELANSLWVADLQATQVQAWPEDLPKPQKFPATLRDFLALIVRAKTQADSMKRFRDFLTRYYQHYNHPRWIGGRLRSKKEAEDKTLETLNAINSADKEPEKGGDEKHGYFTKDIWVRFARAYQFWRRRQKSRKARKSARSRKPRS
jgi:hypothetical protein